MPGHRRLQRLVERHPDQSDRFRLVGGMRTGLGWRQAGGQIAHHPLIRDRVGEVRGHDLAPLRRHQASLLAQLALGAYQRILVERRAAVRSVTVIQLVSKTLRTSPGVQTAPWSTSQAGLSVTAEASLAVRVRTPIKKPPYRDPQACRIPNPGRAPVTFELPPAPEFGAPLDLTPAPQVLAFLARRRSASALTLAEPAPSEGELDTLLHLATRVPD